MRAFDIVGYYDTDTEEGQFLETLNSLFRLHDGRATDKENLFSMACALYWYCCDNYHGQADPLYAIQCTLGYKPGACERGINAEENPLDAEIYDLLQENKLDPERLAKWIKENWGDVSP